MVTVDESGSAPWKEQALRMRQGVGVSHAEPLESVAAEGTELADELLLIEMQLMRAMRARQGKAAATKRPATASPTKSKIVRALRKKR